jgi:hypothetical protein
LFPNLPAPPRAISRHGWRLGGLLAVLLVVMGVAVTGWGHGGIATGTALSVPGEDDMGIAALPPGAKMGILNLAFFNHSGAPLTITNVTITGRGIGTVARVTEVKIAPAHYDPGGLYVSDPPVYHFLHSSWLGPAGCNVQPLVPPHGYTLPPGNGHGFRNIYIWAVVQMIHPGRYRSLGSTVYYTQQGTRYRDFVGIGFDGTVTRHAAWPAIFQEKGCVDKTHLLDPVTAGHQVQESR